MAELSVYDLEVLRKDGELILYRGRSRDALSHVLVLSPVGQRPSPESLKRLENEYSLKEELDPSWATRPIAIATHWDRTVLVLQDPGGVPLNHLLGPAADASAEPDASRQPLDIALALRLAISLSAGIGALHQRGIIHRDMKPANILVNCASGQCWLTGFGIASRRPRERQAPGPPEFIAGTLPYMAPEQTGHMNRSIDSRSDLYALGVVLYEMLTGVLPFTASDPMEWVHCHVARQPIPPSQRIEGIPPALSAAVMKLLAKTAEERYQTAMGVEADLRHCLQLWESAGQMEPFPLGTHDASDRLLVPEKLYGRDQERKVILRAFDEVVTTGAPQLVLVSGYSGIGKSSLVNELHNALAPARGLFASGKFDQYKRDVPYATFAKAFQTLVRQILGKSDAEMNRWRNTLLEALGSNGQLIVNLVPELELVIGKQPSIPELSPKDAQKRFQMVFRQFLGAFARGEHPLALFLDDLQWLDLASLELLEYLITEPSVRYVLLVGAYRNNEVNPSHPLARILAKIRKAGGAVHEIILEPLSQEATCQLVLDSLRCEFHRGSALSRLIFEKTGGNPFFAIQFLTALTDEGLLAFDAAAAEWRWDLPRIHGKGFTDNVVELIAGKLSRLPDETQVALGQLACLGNSAETHVLAIVRGDSEDAVHAVLREAVRAGLVFQSDESYAFTHDRVREAAYALVPDQARYRLHLRIGRLLLSKMTEEEVREKIFDIVNQLNAGCTLVTRLDEKHLITGLNLQAGKRAKASAAYSSACKYLSFGMTLIGRFAWKRAYDLALNLWLERAECEFLTGNLATAEQLISEVLQKGRTKLDKAAAYSLKIHLRVMQAQTAEAVDIALECLRLFGIAMPARPTRDEVQAEYEAVWHSLKGRAVASLMELPRMANPEMQAAMGVMAALFAPAYNTDSNLLLLLICRMVNVSLEYGTTGASTHGYAWFGLILGPVFHRYKDSYQFGKLAIDLVDQHQFLAWKARVYYVMEMALLWTQPLKSAVDFVRAAFRTGVEIGDVTFACYCSEHTVTDLLLQGEHLDQVWLESTKAYIFVRSAKFQDVADVILSSQRFIQQLRGEAASVFSSNCAEDPAFQPQPTERRMRTTVYFYWILRLKERFMFGDYAAALEAARQATRLLWAHECHIQLLDHRYYAALAAAAIYEAAPPDAKAELLKLITEQLKQLKEWAGSSPSTFRDKHLLVAAELARIEGRELEAMRLYQDAIHCAHQNEFVQNEAIASERAAAFYLERGLDKVAHSYIRDARYCYLRWGAAGKARQLDELYPRLGEEMPLPAPASTIGASIEHLDFAALIRVSQALSGEIVLEKLIDTLMRTMIEHAAAERGLLLFPRGLEQEIGAEATTSGDTILVQLRNLPVTAVALPESIIRYVVRTQESVILDDASTDNPFSADRYLSQHHARSILCLPLVNQTKLVGVLYLENSLAPHVFTPTRITGLKILAAQAAISLENTRLYREIEESETKIRRSEAYLARGQRLARTGSFWWKVSSGELIWSDESFRIMGYDRTVHPSMELVFNRVHPEDIPIVQHMLGRAAREGVNTDFEHRLLMPDGSVKHVHLVVESVSLDPENREFVGTVMDITARKQAEEALQKAQAELTHVARMTTLGELSASIAHEINQPLTALVTNASACVRWLAAQNLEQARLCALNVMANGQRASDIIGRVRALAKKAPPQKDWLDLNEAIDEVVSIARSEVRRNRVSLQTRLSQDLPRVFGDKIQLQQVILNLLLNAIEAMSGVVEGPREVWLSSERVTKILGNPSKGRFEDRLADTERDYVLVAVRDSGPGLDPGSLSRLFDAFYTTKPQGLGMGLAISRSIIEAHGGWLRAMANAPRGAVFQFTLPISELEMS